LGTVSGFILSVSNGGGILRFALVHEAMVVAVNCGGARLVTADLGAFYACRRWGFGRVQATCLWEECFVGDVACVGS